MSGRAKQNTHCLAAGFFFEGPPYRIADRQGGNPGYILTKVEGFPEFKCLHNYQNKWFLQNMIARFLNRSICKPLIFRY
jgi:hypothetical protein